MPLRNPLLLYEFTRQDIIDPELEMIWFFSFLSLSAGRRFWLARNLRQASISILFPFGV